MMEKGHVAIPRKATTIILLRDRNAGGFEVFLLKRHEGNVFMGGNFVYPGGKVDKGDADGEIIPYCKGLVPDQAANILGETGSGEESLAYWIAGIRELFEEAGILLACDRTGRPLTIDRDDAKNRYTLHRQRLQKGDATLLQILRGEDLVLALDQCHYCAHWITPEARHVRFDTRFFVARHTPGQEASPDAHETTEGVWMTPAEALLQNLKGTVALSPPTLKTLEDLSKFSTSDDLFTALPMERSSAVLPILLNYEADEVLLFPWDPDYRKLMAGESANPADHGRTSSPSDNTTRLVLTDGRWVPYCKHPA